MADAGGRVNLREYHRSISGRTQREAKPHTSETRPTPTPMLSDAQAATSSSCRAPTLRLELLRERRRLRSLGSRQHVCHPINYACFWRRQILLESELPAALSKMRVRMVHIGHTLQQVGSLGLFRTLRSANSSRGSLSTADDEEEPPPSTRNYDRCDIPLVWWPLWCEICTPKSIPRTRGHGRHGTPTHTPT